MTDYHKLYTGIGRAAWGYFFIYFDINLNTVSILPSFIGYLLFLSAINHLCDEERELNLLRTLGIILTVWHIASWFASFGAIKLDGMLPAVDIIIGVVNIYFHFQLLTNLASIAAKYLGKPVRASLNFERSDVPPIAYIDGVDLVTEGVITMNRVIEYAKDYLGNNELYESWDFKKDGASLISQLLFEEATDINFYVGRAINPAHQNPDLPINFNIKMNLVEELSACLKKMGKRIKVSYF